MKDPSALRRTFAKLARPFKRGWNRGTRSRATTRAKCDSLSVQGCFNCGGNHFLKDCSEAFNMVGAASKKIEYFSRKKNAQLYAVYQVLAEFCQQIDDAEDQTQPQAPTPKDCQIFENLVSSSHREDSRYNDETIEMEANTDRNAENVYFTKGVFELRETDAFLGHALTLLLRRQSLARCRHKQTAILPTSVGKL